MKTRLLNHSQTWLAPGGTTWRESSFPSFCGTQTSTSAPCQRRDAMCWFFWPAKSRAPHRADILFPLLRWFGEDMGVCAFFPTVSGGLLLRTSPRFALPLFLTNLRFVGSRYFPAFPRQVLPTPASFSALFAASCIQYFVPSLASCPAQILRFFPDSDLFQSVFPSLPRVFPALARLQFHPCAIAKTIVGVAARVG